MKNFNKKRLVILLVSVVALLAVAVGGTLAYLFTATDPVENTFAPSKVECEVVETFENNVKSNVQIKNTGDTDAYIRVAVVVTWKNEAGNVWAQSPVAGADYTDWEPGTDWVQSGDYYYYTKSVVPTEVTDNLIDEIKVLDSANIPDGYYLSVEIVASAIQAKPNSVVQDAWGVDPTTLGTN